MDKKSLSSRRQNVFFNNLLALGFDVTAMSKEHKIMFDKKMFLLPNRKGMEVVTYFLLSKLNEVCGGRYSIIWPLVDFKDQRQFQKTSFEYLTRIAQESKIKFPPVLNSVFSTFGGESFFDLYFAFSTHVVQQVNKTFGRMLRRPKFDPKLTKHAIEMLKLTSIASVEKFQALTDSTRFHLETYFSIAQKLHGCVERLKLSNSKSQSLLEDKIKTAVRILNGLAENSLEGLTLKNKEYQDKVEALWRKIEDFLSKEKKMWGIISSELEESAKPILKGSAYSFSLSNNLKNCIEERYQKLRSQLEEEGNHFSIPRFLRLFTVVLEFYVDSMRRGKFSETYKFQLLKQTSELDKSFKMLQSFSALLEKGNDVKKKHLEILKEGIINVHDFAEDESDFIDDLPPSPKACVKSNVDFQNESASLFLCPSVKDVKFDDKIEKVSVLDSSQNLTHQAPKNESVISPLRTDKMNSVTSSNIGLNSDLIESSDEGIFSQTSSQGATANDSVSDVLGFDIPAGWLHEESLNSQTLCDQVSLSFLD